MKKQYTKQQILEALSVWKKQFRTGTGKYTRRQMNEAISYWRGRLDRIVEAEAIKEAELSKKGVKVLADYIEKNKINVADMLKLDKVEYEIAKKDDKVKAAYDILKKAAVELKFSNRSIPALHRALKNMFNGKEAEAKDPKKAAAAIKAEPEKAAKAIQQAAAAGGAGGGDQPPPNDGDRRTGKTIPDDTKKAVVDGIMDTDKNKSTNDAAKAPVGKLNLLGRLFRNHVNARNRATEALTKFLNAKKVPVDETGIKFTNSFADDQAGTFEFKDEPLVITLEVDVDRASVKGFRKFMAVMLKESMEQRGKKLDEGIVDTIVSAFGTALQKGKDKAIESINKANEELKAQVGVHGLQEYVKRFCGPKLAKLVNPKSTFDCMTESNGEMVYRYSIAFTVEKD